MAKPIFVKQVTATAAAVSSKAVSHTVAAGNSLIVGIAVNGSAPVAGITDSAGNNLSGLPVNTWRLINTQDFRGQRLELWACRNMAAITAFTISWGAATVAGVAATSSEWSGMGGFGISAVNSVQAAQNIHPGHHIHLILKEVAVPDQLLVAFFSLFNDTFLSVESGDQLNLSANSSPVPNLMLLKQATTDVAVRKISGGNYNITVDQTNLATPTNLGLSSLQCVALMISGGFTLSRQPGFADVSDTSFAAEKFSLGINLAKISENAAFGMCRLEVFTGYYKNGDTIPPPQSPIDGYAYALNELTYIWAVHSSLNPDTAWITGPDNLWYAAWVVNQLTGEVLTDEWYRRSGSHANPNISNDGRLFVVTIAQRQQQALVIDTPPAYVATSASRYAQDKAEIEGNLQALNQTAKYGVISSEVIYMGEFVDGDVIENPISPADGFAYSYAQCSFQHSWRWTCQGSAYTQPPMSDGQLGPMLCSINASTGAVSVTVKMIDDSGSLNTVSGFGRVAVFAICSRNNGLTLAKTAQDFLEIDQNNFMPGTLLPASILSNIDDNVQEAVVVPEIFGPAIYDDGDTIPTPVSPVDGYVYGRDELAYIWEWADTTNESGSNLRVPCFWGDVEQTTGLVSLEVWRLPPGNKVVVGDRTKASIKVTIIAHRQTSHRAETLVNAFPVLDSNGGADAAHSYALRVEGAALNFESTGQITVGISAGGASFAGVTTFPVAKMVLMKTLTGSLSVVGVQQFLFNKSASITLNLNDVKFTDPLLTSLDREHDYYIVLLTGTVSGIGGAIKYATVPDTSLDPIAPSIGDTGDHTADTTIGFTWDNTTVWRIFSSLSIVAVPGSSGVPTNPNPPSDMGPTADVPNGGMQVNGV